MLFLSAKHSITHRQQNYHLNIEEYKLHVFGTFLTTSLTFCTFKCIYMKINNFFLFFVIFNLIAADLAGNFQLAENRGSSPLFILDFSLSFFQSFRQLLLNPLCLLIALQDRYLVLIHECFTFQIV